MNETRRLLEEAFRALRAYKSPQELIEEIAKHLDAPQWTREPPTKPGWYWARVTKGLSHIRSGDIECVHVYDFRGREPLISVAGWDGGNDVEAFDLWAGPIEAPPLPEGS